MPAVKGLLLYQLYLAALIPLKLQEGFAMSCRDDHVIPEKGQVSHNFESLQWFVEKSQLTMFFHLTERPALDIVITSWRVSEREHHMFRFCPLYSGH